MTGTLTQELARLDARREKETQQLLGIVRYLALESTSSEETRLHEIARVLLEHDLVMDAIRSAERDLLTIREDQQA